MRMTARLDNFKPKLSIKEKENRKRFGNELRIKRKCNNLSIKQVADQSGVSQELINRIESGLVKENNSLKNKIISSIEKETLVIK
jgi:predicted transcriptional regulator